MEIWTFFLEPHSPPHHRQPRRGSKMTNVKIQASFFQGESWRVWLVGFGAACVQLSATIKRRVWPARFSSGFMLHSWSLSQSTDGSKQRSLKVLLFVTKTWNGLKDFTNRVKVASQTWRLSVKKNVPLHWCWLIVCCGILKTSWKVSLAFCITWKCCNRWKLVWTCCIPKVTVKLRHLSVLDCCYHLGWMVHGGSSVCSLTSLKCRVACQSLIDTPSTSSTRLIHFLLACSIEMNRFSAHCTG